ncbi:MAG TPA: RluA family pseudouridine synthase [Firmicutes bacterium]|nr:RluA family pseudouridine synthase [Candidatus Fermentithermobacillaceae bacterium]
MPDMSRSRARRLIDDGNVLVSGAKAKPSYRVKTGDVVDVTVPPPEPTDLVPEPLEIDVVYEDEDILVVNKPRGMVIHPAKGHWHETMANALLYHCRGIEKVGDLGRPGIVHRLDKDTTGLIVVAKSERAFAALQRQMRDRIAKRDYLAIVSGVVRDDAGTIEAPIGRHPVHRKKMAVVEGGRTAVTRFEVLCRSKRYTLIQAHLETGRTHQIRVHMSYIGHPVAGDPVYGRREGELGLGGQALHAWQLQLVHPADGSSMTFRAPPPPDFLNALSVLSQEMDEAMPKHRGVPGLHEAGKALHIAGSISNPGVTTRDGPRKGIPSWVLEIKKEWLKFS